MAADAFIRIAPDSTGKHVDNTVRQRNGVEVYRQRVDAYPGAPIAIDTAGRTRSSSLITLFDGKVMNAEDPYKWDTAGSGTPTYTANAVELAVTPGQYLIRQGRLYCPYFSGKPQLIEFTQAGFANQPGVVKRVGYFSSSGVAPYDADKDGWWLEADGSTYRLICSRDGVETHNIPWTDWDAYAEIAGYDWSKFTVCQVDFLWLGGAALRLFMVIDGEFKLLHTIANHAGYQDGLIFLSPNQPMRYEIRSTTGAGQLTSICSQVATEGSGINEQGEGLAWYSPLISANTVGQVFALVGVRKNAALRNHHCFVTEFGAGVTTSDSGVLLLLLNPTLSAPLTYTDVSRVQKGVASAPILVTDLGRILKAVPIVSAGLAVQAPSALLRNLLIGIDNTPGELVVAYAPQTTNQAVFGSLQVMEY